MAGERAVLPRFAFSRRDPSAILGLAEKRQREAGGVRLLALGGQPRDRVYCAQLLAEAAGQAFLHLDLGRGAADPELEKAALERMLAFSRATPTTLCLDGAETLFQRRDGSTGERAGLLGGYLKRTLAGFGGTVVFGMPEQVEPDYSRLPSLDMEVTFRAPSGTVVAGKPVLLPSHVIREELLPSHNFQVEIDGLEVGMCAVTAPVLIAGSYSEFDFDPQTGVQGFQGQGADVRAAWPTITLRRGVTQSKLFYAWKQSQYGGKPLLRDLLVRQLDWPGRRVVNTWAIEGCWAKRWTGPTFDAVQGGVAEEELELFYQKVMWR
jgi:phage tail-like protein